MSRSGFLQMKLDNFSEDVIIEYKLREKVNDKVFVILRAEKGMYGLPYAGIIAQNMPEKRLEKHKYTQIKKNYLLDAQVAAHLFHLNSWWFVG